MDKTMQSKAGRSYQKRTAIFSICLLTVLFLFAPVFLKNSFSDEGILPPVIKGATYVGTETCATCHEKEDEEFRLSTHARIAVKGNDVEAQGCEMCHGPGSVHVDAGGGKGTIINPLKNPETCFTCHSDKKAEFRLPYRHPVLEGKMTCSDCHEAHGQDVRPWTATSEKAVNEVCLKCHLEKRGPFVWEHDALREGCTVCHKVHGSVNDKMLLSRDNTLCLRCHGQINFPFVSGQNHIGNRLQAGACFSGACHEAVHGSNYSDLFRN